MSMLTVEWTVENFSFWNNQIHDTVITSPKFPFGDWHFLELKLYPRGRSGSDELITTYLGGDVMDNLYGNLTFTGPDESVLYSEAVYCRKMREDVRLSYGSSLVFEEVISLIKNREKVHQDKLTLRLKINRRHNREEFLRTKIEVFDYVLKISDKQLDRIFVSESMALSQITFPIEDSEMGYMRIIADGRQEKLNLRTLYWNLSSNVLIFTCVSVFDTNNVVIKTEENERFFPGYIAMIQWLFSNSVTRDVEKKVSLLVRVRVVSARKFKHICSYHAFHPDIVHVSSSTDSPTGDISVEQNNSVKVLQEDLMSLSQEQEFSDFQINCENRSFAVHKNILSARSPVFKRLIMSNMKEAESGPMHIVDMDPSTLSSFLSFLYSGTPVHDLPTEAVPKLYYAADKYQVSSLKAECLSVMRATVSVSNVCDILLLADLHQSQEDGLKLVAHDFILKNTNKVLRSEEWKNLVNHNPLLVAKTFTKLAENNLVTFKRLSEIQN